MTVVHAKIRVAPDGTISGKAPGELPPGEYDARINVSEEKAKRTLQDYVESLRSKHSLLEQQIDNEMHRPLPDRAILTRLKREKLRTKDELARLQSPPRAAAPLNLPLHDCGPWPEGFRVRRKEIYGDAGR